MLSYRDQWVIRGRSGLPEASLFQVLLCNKGLSQAREQIFIFGRVCQRLGRFLIDLRQALSPQLHYPIIKHTEKNCELKCYLCNNKKALPMFKRYH